MAQIQHMEFFNAKIDEENYRVLSDAYAHAVQIYHNNDNPTQLRDEAAKLEKTTKDFQFSISRDWYTDDRASDLVDDCEEMCSELRLLADASEDNEFDEE